jgi:aminopeptidase-like protein
MPLVDLVEVLFGSVVWLNKNQKYLGLDKDGCIRQCHGENGLMIYCHKRGIDSASLRGVWLCLIAKIVSLAFYPGFDFVETEEDRVELYSRMRKTIENLIAIVDA